MRREYFEKIEKFLIKKNWILDEKYEDLKEKSFKSIIKIKCQNNHNIEIKACYIFKNSSCKECRNLEYFVYYKNIAKEKGGDLICDAYKGITEKHTWQCKNGHQWKTTPAKIRIGRWCHLCNNYIRENLIRYYFENLTQKPFPKVKPDWLVNSRGYKLELDGYCTDLKIAFEHQGEHHYGKIIKFNDLNKFQRIQENDEYKKLLCEKNKINLVIIKYDIPIDELKNFILKEIQAINSNIHIYSIEDKKHIFDLENKLEKYRVLAATKNGKLLDTIYKGVLEYYTFECEFGHQWKTTLHSVHNGNWCQECGVLSIKKKLRKYNINEIKDFINKKNGKYLSENFENLNDKLLIQCKNGHQWETTWYYIKKGSWCNICRNNDIKINTLKIIKKLCIEKNGKCLSSTYNGKNDKLLIQCKNGHQWEALAQTLKKGHWCRKCCYQDKIVI